MNEKRKFTGMDRIHRINHLMHSSADPNYSVKNTLPLYELGVDHIITEMFIIKDKYKDGVSIEGYIATNLRVDRLLLPEELIKLLRKGNLFLLTIGRIGTGKWKLLSGSNMYL